MSPSLIPVQLKITASQSLVAAAAAITSAVVIEVPVWAMFIGWIAHFTRGVGTRQGLINLACVLIGLGIGVAAGIALGLLTPHWGAYAIGGVVFVVAALVLSLRNLPKLNNLLAFFLGLVCWFAAHLPPSPGAFAKLAMAVSLGAFAGWLASQAQRHWGPVGVH
jgi:hypothetical protein